MDIKNCIKDIKEGVVKKGISPLIIVLVIGIILLVVPVSEKDKKSDDKKDNIKSFNKINSDEEEYKKQLEKEITTMIKDLNDVEDASVYLTLNTSYEDVVLKDIPLDREEKEDTKKYSSKEETVLIEDDEGNTHPYVTKKIKPKVEGVVVSVKTKKNLLYQEIIEVIQVLFDVPIHKIKVVNMK